LNDAVERARTLSSLGRWAEAAQALRPALADPAAGADPWCLLARCELGMARAAPAREAARRAVAAEPDAEWGHRLVSVASLRLGDHETAMAACLRSLELAPDLCEGLHLLTTLTLARPARAKGGGALEADKVAQRNLQLNSDRALAWEGAADVAIARKLWTQAEEYARRGLAIDPQDSELAMILGTALDRQGRSAEAGNAYAAAARADPHDHRARRAIGRLGLPLAGAGLLLAKLGAIAGIRGAALWVDAPVWALGVALAVVIGGAYVVLETMAWRARRTLTPALQAIARRERRTAARGWLAASAFVAALLALRAAALPDVPTTGVLVLLIAVLLTVRSRLPRPIDHRPGWFARTGQSIRRRFR
jgi:tetratricopeptide (TPR) repeat protein